MSAELVTTTRFGSTAVVTLNTPQRRNVLSVSLVNAIADTYSDLEGNGQTQSVVLTGAGTTFCAGAELGTLRASAEGNFDLVEAVYGGFLRVLQSPLVTIGAINGPAVGAGMNLALACDIRLASQAAVFDTRFAALHIHPGGGHLWLLTRAVGAQSALLATLFGEVWDAPTALDHGLVAAVHAADDLVPVAVTLARRLDDQEPSYTRRVVHSARAAVTTAEHAIALADETVAQRWSTTQPAFLNGVSAIESAIGADRR